MKMGKNKKHSINVVGLIVAVYSAVKEVVKALGKDSEGGAKVTPAEGQMILAAILSAADEYIEDHLL
jgi:hypothetical protein|tara:strand:- start:3231 stop:3431 length:201 start_codon:yes stop_codon:yes gene_type:complete